MMRWRLRSPRKLSNAVSRRHWAWFVGVALLTVLIRVPALVHPRAIDDETIYSVVALEMLEGGDPYVDAVERKPPLLFWTYELTFRVVGAYNWVGLHIVAVLWVLFSVWMCYLIGRNLIDERVGLVAAVLYSVYQPWAYWRNLAFNGEVLMNLPVLLAIWIVFRPARSSIRLELIVAGALLCAAFLLKQPAAIAAVPIGVYLLLPSYRRSRGIGVRQSVVQAALLTIGFFGTLAGVVAYLAGRGILADAYYWTIADHDVPHGPTDPVFWIRGGRYTVAFVAACAPLVIGAILSLRAGAFGRDRWATRRPEFITLVGLLFVSILGVSVAGRFYPHYYIQLLPPLALLAAPALAGAWTARSPGMPWYLRRSVGAVWLAATVVVFLVSHVVGLAPRRAAGEAARYIRENSVEADRVFVWGQNPSVYLDARRRPASRYVATFPLTGYIFGSPLSWDPDYDTAGRIVPGSWDNLQADLAEHPPRFIVDTDAARATARYPMRDFPALQEYVDEMYEVVYRAADGVIYRRLDPQ
jgi:4-amino-4-deoxy-L-arabinose transferase-like glycosyltransferase